MIRAVQTIDAVIIAGPKPQEFLGGEIREKMRVSIDGHAASLNYLRQWFDTGRDSAAAFRRWQGQELSFLSLNGPYLCQFLEQHGLSTAWVPIFQPDDPHLLDVLAQQPRTVVISTTFLPLAPQIDQMAAEIRRLCPDAHIIAGGTQVWKSYQHLELVEAGHITPDILPAVAAHNYFIDATRPSPIDTFLINPRGEEALVELVQCLKDGKDRRMLKNVAYWEDGRWRINEVVKEAYREVRVDWASVLARDVSVWVPIQAGQGCGFRCTFCDFYGLNPKVNIRENLSLLDEIATIPEVNGFRRLYFTDDNLFTSKQRAREFCAELAKAKHLNIKWRGMIRVAIVDAEIAQLMYDSGCVEVLLGIESGDRQVLINMKKLSTPKQILDGLKVLNDHGINTKSTFIVGFPGETTESVSNTIQLLNDYPCDGPGVHRYTAFTFGVLPLAAVSRPEMRERYGLKGYGFTWKHDTMDSDQAATETVRLLSSLKPELSPSYVMEVSDIDGVPRPEMKRLYTLRNRIAVIDRDIRTGKPLNPEVDFLLSELEDSFKRCPVSAVGV